MTITAAHAARRPGSAARTNDRSRARPRSTGRCPAAVPRRSQVAPRRMQRLRHRLLPRVITVSGDVQVRGRVPLTLEVEGPDPAVDPDGPAAAAPDAEAHAVR